MLVRKFLHTLMVGSNPYSEILDDQTLQLICLAGKEREHNVLKYWRQENGTDHDGISRSGAAEDNQDEHDHREFQSQDEEVKSPSIRKDLFPE